MPAGFPSCTAGERLAHVHHGDPWTHARGDRGEVQLDAVQADAVQLDAVQAGTIHSSTRIPEWSVQLGRPTERAFAEKLAAWSFHCLPRSHQPRARTRLKPLTATT